MACTRVEFSEAAKAVSTHGSNRLPAPLRIEWDE